MEESLSVLTEAKECLEDEILVAMVKIYLVLDRMYHVRRDGETINPPSFYLKTFQMQLDAVKQEIPGNVQLHSKFLAPDGPAAFLTSYRGHTVVLLQCRVYNQ